MTDFVLVHGALFGAWCWDEVALLLRSDGHRVRAVDLPGSGPDPTPLQAIGLHNYADAVVDACGGLSSPVLVGHSFGGLPVTVAAQRTNVSRVVYLAAFAPTSEHNSIAALLALPEAVGEGLRGAVTVSGSPPVARLSPEDGWRVLYQDATVEQAVAFGARLGPHPTWLTAAPAGDLSKPVPSAYIACLRDRAVPLALQRRMAAGASRVAELDADHCPFLTVPRLVADALVLAAEP